MYENILLFIFILRFIGGGKKFSRIDDLLKQNASFFIFHHCTYVVNFINVKRTNFSYEHRISAASSSYMYVEKRRSYEKFVRLTLMK